MMYGRLFYVLTIANTVKLGISYIKRETFQVVDICTSGIKKVKLSLFLTKHHAMKAYWGVEV
jgi:hypothetical protein